MVSKTPRTTPTVVVDQGQDQLTKNLIQAFPTSWFDPAAFQPDINPQTGKKGGWWSLFHSIAGNLETINKQLIYGWQAQRFNTASDIQVDLISKDYFGDQLPRLPGEPDESFIQRIQAQLFLPYATREGFVICITRLTGFAPRLIEPWNTGDTGGYDWSCYDADSAGNPSLYGDAGLRYQAAVIAVLPPANQQGVAVPIWGYDAGAAYDAQTGVYWEPIRNMFSSQDQLDALINRIRAYGITIWRKYLIVPLISWIIGQNYGLNAGIGQQTLTVQPFVGPYFVFVSGNWNGSFCVPFIGSTSFEWKCSSPTPAFSQLYTLLIPFTVPFVGSVPIAQNAYSLTLNVPIGATNRLVVMPNWATTVFIQTMTANTVTLNFGTAAPVGGMLSTYWAPDNKSGLQSVAINSPLVAVPAPVGNFAPFCVPSWNTPYSVTVDSGQMIFRFNVPAPTADCFIQWSAIQI